MANTHTDPDVGKKIVELREQRGWNQGQLAELLRENDLNWSQGTLSKVEAGLRPVRLAEAPALALVLRTTIGELVGADEPTAQPMPANLQHAVLDQLDAIKDALSNAHRIKEFAEKSVPLLEASWGTTSNVLDHLVGKAEDEYTAGLPKPRSDKEG